MNFRPRPTLTCVPQSFVLIVLAVLALACFVVAAWGVDWRLGLLVLGVSLLILEWRVSGE